MKAVAAILLSAATAVVAIPPGIPSEADARSMLSNLKVAEPNDDGSYDRDLFPHWSSVEGNCNAREFVLRRDGDNVETGNDCYPTSGSWTSPYEGEKHTEPSDVSIDHMVPLKNAWISGASEWTTDEREAFANDVEGPQLWAVTGTVNSDKSDKSPDEWKPELTSIHCEYAAAWIAVKSAYELTASSAEVSALEEMLGEC
ncbi:hypothetical protein ACRE_009360 [Hapsidospora chrysogenum ATCC 11550]|uniref:GmrSD restriction endonucleases C-terminal domain-containing protein n=1 Tax=Hapsidospora chrysogenum (strain ATCC 11550 / CBS 779.69 / DSM 880 / IAM 14645 / JCM 23072 / IMI 49137) TaxID=857340 RepID=A0A086TFP8_HAPC1|nr:hypothetical protein ACRE_009360 [Hapsidospora chrysogenum ATCC 11550]